MQNAPKAQEFVVRKLLKVGIKLGLKSNDQFKGCLRNSQIFPCLFLPTQLGNGLLPSHSSRKLELYSLKRVKCRRLWDNRSSWEQKYCLTNWSLGFLTLLAFQKAWDWKNAFWEILSAPEKWHKYHNILMNMNRYPKLARNLKKAYDIYSSIDL